MLVPVCDECGCSIYDAGFLLNGFVFCIECWEKMVLEDKVDWDE
jgi:hypothetical protein